MSGSNNFCFAPSSGVSFISLIASTEDLFYSTVSFYIDLGFVEVSVYDRALPTQKRNSDHCLASEKETWLLSQGEGEGDGTNVTLKVRFISEARHWKDGAGRKDSHPAETGSKEPDWRGSHQSIVFHTPHMERVLELLKGKGHSYQCQPNERDVME
ncbi:hypothetical protein K440DRAFT_553024, partial [Wilcoxina mikolae CBS 423.85]